MLLNGDTGVSELAINTAEVDWTKSVIANRSQFFSGGRAAKPRPVQKPAASPAETPASVAPQHSAETARPVSEIVIAPVIETIMAPVLSKARLVERPGFYALVTVWLTLAGVMAVWFANLSFAPEMYGNGMDKVAEAFSEGKNYAVFDLNINIRKLRDETVARMKETPDLVILGASQWQEAHTDLLPGFKVYNSHVHRDYWEDMLGVSEIWLNNGHLPKHMIITIRDNLFTPVSDRTDFLWEPGIPYYRAMADRLGLPKESFWNTMPWHRMRERLSLSMLFDNVTRWYNAAEKPHATTERNFDSLDTLLPDGSILWSAKHRKIFTQERSRREALALASIRRNHPPEIDPAGVEAMDRLLTFLERNGVEVTLAHPPFNPIFFDQVRDSPYSAGLSEIEHLTQEFAVKHGLNIIGSFDPARVGCEARMYIDAEHSSPECIGKLLTEWASLHTPEKAPESAGEVQ